MEILIHGFRLMRIQTMKYLTKPNLKRIIKIIEERKIRLSSQLQRIPVKTYLNNSIDLSFRWNNRLNFKRQLSLIISLFYLFAAPVLQVLPVYAAEPAAALSVWDFMVTELVGANCIITDSAVLSAYGSSLGSLNAATATAAEIDAAIATAAVNCGVDLAPVFANTAASAATVGVEAAAATAGENLATTCAGFYAAGEGSAVIPAIGQVLMDAAGVAGIVAGIAYIGKMVADTVGDVIKHGQKLDMLSQLASVPTAPATGYGSGSSMGTVKRNRDSKLLNCVLGSPVGYIVVGNNYEIYALNNTDNRIMGQIWFVGTNSWSNASSATSPYSYNRVLTLVGQLPYDTISNARQFNSTNEIQTYLNKFQTGEYQPVFPSTTSIASSNGYQKYNPDYEPSNPETGVPGFPEIKPLPDYANGYGLEPINPPSYQALVNAILEVPGNPSYLEEQLSNDNSIAEIVQPLISPHLVPLPEVNPNPNPQPTGSPDPQPTGSPNPNPNPNPRPTTVPFPNPESVPDSPPIIQDTPESDIVPAPVPYPNPSTPTDQERDDTTEKIPPYDLTKKFPFCIPFDILAAFKLFSAGREAPHFVWHIPFGAAGEQVIDIDLAAWDDIAALGRFLQLILFIIILGVGTNNLLRP